MPITPSDFSGVLTLVNSTGGAVVAGDIATIQSNRFLVLGPQNLGGTLANGDTIVAMLISPFVPKVLRNAVKTAGQAWTAGQTVYLITGTNVWTSTKGTNLVGGIVYVDAASADVVGSVVPTIPYVAAV